MEDSDKFSVLLGMFSDEIGNFRNSPKGSQMLLMVRNFFFLEYSGGHRWLYTRKTLILRGCGSFFILFPVHLTFLKTFVCSIQGADSGHMTE